MARQAVGPWLKSFWEDLTELCLDSDYAFFGLWELDGQCQEEGFLQWFKLLLQWNLQTCQGQHFNFKGRRWLAELIARKVEVKDQAVLNLSEEEPPPPGTGLKLPTFTTKPSAIGIRDKIVMTVSQPRLSTASHSEGTDERGYDNWVRSVGHKKKLRTKL